MEVLDSQMRIQRLKSQIAEATTAAPRLEAAQKEAESRVKEAIARFRAEASSELTRVREEIEELSHEIDTSIDRLERNIVRSPVAGLINRLNITTIGAVVRQVFEQAPERFVVDGAGLIERGEDRSEDLTEGGGRS